MVVNLKTCSLRMEVRFLLLWVLLGLLSHQALTHDTYCSHGNKTTCLESVRQYFHSTEWWFGDGFSTECPKVTPGNDVTSFHCHNPSPYKTIGSRLLQKENYNLNDIQQVLRIRYFAPAGGYEACGHRFSIPEVQMTHDVDSTHVLYTDSWSLQQRPAVIWEASPDTTYILALYDVGEMRLCGLWVNIQGGDSALGEEVVPYCSFMSPVYRRNFLVFALFEQNGTISDSAKKIVSDRFWGSTSRQFMLTTAMSLMGQDVRDPMAIGYVSIWTDGHSIQRYKDMSLINNCPFLAARQPALVQIMDGFNLTDRYKTALDYRGLYFDDLKVQLEVYYWSEAIAYNVCCSAFEEPERLLTIDPLAANPVSPVYLRDRPDLLLSPVHSSDKTFFLGKWFTLLLLDVTDVSKTTPDFVTSLLWMITDLQGPSFPGRGQVQQNYTVPAPPLGQTRLYMFFVFGQTDRLSGSFSLVDYCKNADVENCDLDLHKLVTTYDLHFSGVNWFRVTGDSFIRWKMIQDQPQSTESVCQQVKGYSNPCPAIVCPPQTTSAPHHTQQPTTGQPPGETTTRSPNGSSHLVPSWHLQSYLLSFLLFSFISNNIVSRSKEACMSLTQSSKTTKETTRKKRSV